MDDTELRKMFHKAKRGDAAAFEEVYTACYAPVYRYLYVRTSSKELAEDLAQETFLKAYASVSSFTFTDSSPLAYLYTIARNALIDFRRKKQPQQVEEDFFERIPDAAPHTEERAAASEEYASVLAGLRLLPDEQQEIITLKYVSGLSTREIARMTGKSEEAIRQALSRGIRALREHMNTSI